MRYLIGDNEPFERGNYRFVYDTLYKTFVIVQQLRWLNRKNEYGTVKRAPDNFYVYFPGFARNLRESDKLPNWK